LKTLLFNLMELLKRLDAYASSEEEANVNDKS
jgi:hypothetical protein